MDKAMASKEPCVQQIWLNRDPIIVSDIKLEIIKVCSSGEVLYLLCRNHSVFSGHILDSQLKIKPTNISAIDIATNATTVYYISEEGSIFRFPTENLEFQEELYLEEESRCCSHGVGTPARKHKARSLAVSDTGCLFIAEDSRLWACGSHEQLNIDSENPQLVTFFASRRIESIACGSVFHLALVHRQISAHSSCSEELEVFAPDCASCTDSRSGSDVVPPLFDPSSSSTASRDPSVDRKSTDDSTSISLREDGDLITTSPETGDIQVESKRTEFLVNAEAARQFLSRQLIWGGDDSVVSTMASYANLVYEGVRTLSRHVSGSSDTNDDIQDVEQSFTHISPELILNEETKCQENHMKAVRSSSEAAGSNLLLTEVWSWGENPYGELGLGDCGIRSKPALINRLNGIGVTHIACGQHHAAALTLDGRVFLWGKGIDQQAKSTPTVVELIEGRRACDMSLGSKHIAIASFTSDVLLMDGKGSCFLPTAVQLIAGGPLTILSSTKWQLEVALQPLAIEQAFLEEMLLVLTTFIRPVRRSNIGLEAVCISYQQLVNITATSIASLHLVARGTCPPTSCMIVEQAEEMVQVYRNYMLAVCDAISAGTFSAAVEMISPRLQKCFAERAKTLQRKQARIGESIIESALLHPLIRCHVFKTTVRSLVGIETSATTIWQNLCDSWLNSRREAETTRTFWEGPGSRLEGLRVPHRRWIRDSKAQSLAVHNAGRFVAPWLVLLSDGLVAAGIVHPAATIWAEAITTGEAPPHTISLTMPEDNLIVQAPSAQSKAEWLQALHSVVKTALGKANETGPPPQTRTAIYTFTKHAHYREACYQGRWHSGKPHGTGRMTWPDGRVLSGHWNHGSLHGTGISEGSEGRYEGQWRDGVRCGTGIMKYTSGAVYEGQWRDNLPHGHGVRKQGRLAQGSEAGASVYVGEWTSGTRNGYGVLDDIAAGQKYLGQWQGDVPQGPGLVVTLDGIYYEGPWVQGQLQGKGLMVLEDGTHFEGEMRGAGHLSGRGVITLPSGDRVEGVLHGAWHEEVKINHGSFLRFQQQAQGSSQPPGFGSLCVQANDKWKALFRQCNQTLGVGVDTDKLWENIAVAVSSSHQEAQSLTAFDELATIPKAGRENLDVSSFSDIQRYLTKAFDSPHHPLGRLLSQLCAAYTATYGGVRVHPLLLRHAVSELRSITNRLYEVVRLLFPALPPLDTETFLSDGTAIGACTVIHPSLLPRVHSALFVLYALHNKPEDDKYWSRVLSWNRRTPGTLARSLSVEPRLEALGEDAINGAVDTLQQLKTTFSPAEKLEVVRRTFAQLTGAAPELSWPMDQLFPVFLMVVIRASVLQLGSEIHFVEDFIDPAVQMGELGIMFTTLKACYYQILQEKVSVSS